MNQSDLPRHSTRAADNDEGTPWVILWAGCLARENGGSRTKGGDMETQRMPPSVEAIADALRPIVRTGLPVDPHFDDMTLLALRGVVARSIDMDARLTRVKSLDGLLRKLLAFFPDDVLSEAARVLFGMTPGTRGKTLTERRGQAARETGYDAEHFRKRVEPRILRQLAWQLHQDSQNYIPRERDTPPPLEISGDTPYIAQDDISAKDVNEHQEAMSRLWAAVYELRADILLVERLKTWAYDETEPELSQETLDAALKARNGSLRRVRMLIEQYVQEYGERIEHGDAEFNARALLRLASW